VPPSRSSPPGSLGRSSASTPMTVVGEVERIGLDVIFSAFFMALLVAELRSGGKRELAATAIAVALAAALVPFAPPGVPVLPACVVALLGLRERSS
jgi:predicted branched-subunit amino acid permease